MTLAKSPRASDGNGEQCASLLKKVAEATQRLFSHRDRVRYWIEAHLQGKCGSVVNLDLITLLAQIDSLERLLQNSGKGALSESGVEDAGL